MNKLIKNYLTVVLMVVTVLTGCQKEKKETVPVLTTSTVSNITTSSSTSGGNITNDGGATVTTRGVCWSIGITPTIADNKTSDGNGSGSFTSNITGMNGGAIYYVRAYATNMAGTGYGMAMSITTLGQSPLTTIATVTNLNVTGATFNGSVNANFLSTVVTFEYGTTTSYGSTISANQSPATGNIATNVSANVTGLIAGTTYHFRIKAINSLGSTYTNDIAFKTVPVSVIDVEGNIYNVVAIGIQTQIWMKENLKTSKYGNGDLIGTTAPATKDISTEITPKYQWAYDGNESNVATYGRLYTWYAVTDSRNVCPTGWHVPTEAEWTILTEFLKNNGFGYRFSNNIGKSMAATSGWNSSSDYGVVGYEPVGYDQTSNNSSGFTALPGGGRSGGNKPFYNIGDEGVWWSATESTSTWSWYHYMFYNAPDLFTDPASKQGGNSVRCLRD